MAKAPASAFLAFQHHNQRQAEAYISPLGIEGRLPSRSAAKLMRTWANYVNPVKAENVVPIHERVSVLDFSSPAPKRLRGASPAGDSMRRSVATYLKRVPATNSIINQ